MLTQDAIRQRRAVKHFDPDHAMSPEDVRRLMELTVLSPTAFNIQNWRLVLLREPELRRQVREAAWGQAQVTDASLLVVLCADLNAWRTKPERYWRDAPPEVASMVVPMIHNYRPPDLGR